ncbi:VOC family protein [Aeromonas molluscorum]|jgi:catechol 2,3-dioxygenase-like lactoylglutathione lyase family enzyme|uniref:VOC family protein n=1 Tax=Aeromonas molluscorum TaxID=271417 RepID=UPI003CC1DC83
MISHIDHLVLTVSDIERSVAFYRAVLNMEAITFGAGRRALRFGNQKINLQLLGQEPRNRAQVGAGDLCLISHWPLDEVMRHLREQGIPLIEGPVVKSGAMGEISSVYFLDPDANLIEVSVYPHLQEGGHRHSDGKECR